MQAPLAQGDLPNTVADIINDAITAIQQANAGIVPKDAVGGIVDAAVSVPKNVVSPPKHA